MHCTTRPIATFIAIATLGAMTVACGSRPAGQQHDETCVASGYSIEQLHYFGQRPTQPPLSLLIVGDEHVHYSAPGTRATTGSNLELFSIDTLTGKIVQQTTGERDTVLIDARGGAVLYKQCTRLPLGANYDCDLILSKNGESKALGWYQGLPGSFDYVPSYTADEPHLIGGEGLTAWTDDSSVYVYDGRRTTKIAALAGTLGSVPFATSEAIAWSVQTGGDSAVYFYRDGKVSLVDQPAPVEAWPYQRAVVIAGTGADTRVAFACADSICLWDERSKARVIDRPNFASQTGSCQGPVSDGQRAAWVCDGRIKRYDPARDDVETIAEAANVAALRIAGDYLVWLETFDKANPFDDTGLIVFGDGQHRLEVAHVRLPCIPCNRYDPPLMLSLAADGWIAWSYAIRPESDPVDTAYAYAKIQRHCD